MCIEKNNRAQFRSSTNAGGLLLSQGVLYVCERRGSAVLARIPAQNASLAEQSGGGTSLSMMVTSKPLRSKASPVNMPHMPEPTIVTVGR